MNPIQTAIANLFRIPTMKPKQRNYAGAKRDGVSMSGWATSGSSVEGAELVETYDPGIPEGAVT